MAWWPQQNRGRTEFSLSRSCILFCLLVVPGAGCQRAAAPVPFLSTWHQAQESYEHGDYKKTQSVLDGALGHPEALDPNQIWRLRLVKAELLISQGLNPDALVVLNNATEPGDATLAALRRVLLAEAHANLRQFEPAEQTFAEAGRMPAAHALEVEGELLLGEGRLAAARSDSIKAEQLYKRGLHTAQDHGQTFLAARVLSSLGILRMQQGRYADAADFCSASVAAATRIDAQVILEQAQVNLGWAYRRMGDLERANELFQQSQAKAKRLGALRDRMTALMNIGAIHFTQHDFSAAEQDYQQALALARQLDNKQAIGGVLTDLAQTAMEQNNFALAERYNTEALQLQHALGDHEVELYSLVNEGRIAAAKKNNPAAIRILQQVIHDSGSDPGLQSTAFGALANLQAGLHHTREAQRFYEAAVAAQEKVRQALGRDELKLSYPTNTKDLYDDYIDFLVNQHKNDEAFRVAELQRARTLTEGLGSSPVELRSFNPELARQAAARSGHIILSYWIGSRSSYLWALFPGGVRFFVLPEETRIRKLVSQYQSHLSGAFDTTGIANPYGEELYRILIGPVETLLKPEAAVTIIADGPLCALNFETLVVSAPKPHYWIEDVSVTNASSAVLLALGSHTAERSPEPGKKLLLIGNPQQPANYPLLSHAGEEIRLISAHFPADQKTVLAGAEATPKAYLRIHPENYSLIHFVAHGTASRVSPLDSAVVLSQDDASYNLYARDIAAGKLHARLVTISACDSAGSRIYSSEGLVGLSWSFLRAGAQQVIASMWEVNDASTPRMMDHLYSALDEGKDPASALRAAKLAMVRSGTIEARPFYWAPFLLYQGIGTR